MSSILEGELASEVIGALDAARIPVPVAIRVTIPGSGPSYNPGPSITQDYAGTGWPESYEDDEIDGTRVAATDVRVMVIRPGLGIEPTTSHRVIVGGRNYAIMRVKRDPSGAVYEIQARA